MFVVKQTSQFCLFYDCNCPSMRLSCAAVDDCETCRNPVVNEKRESRSDNQHSLIMKISASQNIVRNLIGRIEDGRLNPNALVPSIRSLAEEFQTTKHSVHVAIRQLEKEGWCYKEGSRYFVAKPALEGSGMITPAESVVILADPVEMNFNNLLVPGYDRSIEVGAMLSVRHFLLHPLVWDPRRFEQEPRKLRHIIDRRPIGVIVFHNTDIAELSEPLLNKIRNAGIPVAVYGNGRQFEKFDTVESDHEYGMYMLTRYLIQRGRRRILRLVPFSKKHESDLSWFAARHRGYDRAIAEAGLEPLDPLHMEDGTTLSGNQREFEHSVHLISGLLTEHMVCNEPVDAIMTTSDGDCFPVISACKRFRRIPHRDIDVVGYDNYWMDSFSRNYEPTPPLATVDKHNFELGKALVDLVLARARKELPAKAEHRLIRPEIILPEEMKKRIAGYLSKHHSDM